MEKDLMSEVRNFHEVNTMVLGWPIYGFHDHSGRSAHGFVILDGLITPRRYVHCPLN